MRRAVVGLLVVVLLGAVTVVGVDRYLLARTERQVVADLAAAGLTLSPDAEVDIAGFPFLTQVWRGRVDDAALTASAATIESLDLTDVTVRARGIGTAAPSTVEDLTVAATAPAATLTEAVARSPLGDQGFDVTIGIADGKVLASTTVLGLPVEVRLEPEPHLREIGLGISGITVAGVTLSAADLPRPLRDALAEVRVPLTGMPEGLEITGVEVLDDGLRVTLVGSDVVLDDLTASRPAG